VDAQTSVFDLFRIGVGPSGSHTVGPMRAALEFAQSLDPAPVTSVEAELFGSLAPTGKGHAADFAIRKSKTINLPGRHTIPFHEETDLLFHRDMVLPGHTNAMRCTVFGKRTN
jgi:L-serine dehydratase